MKYSIANNGPNTIYGTVFADKLYGYGGNDSIYGGLGIDYIDGGSGDDNLIGNEDADFLKGGLGNDFLLGGTGGDELDGGPGNDTASYAGANSGVVADLMYNEYAGRGEAKGDSFTSIENLVGSSYSDTLRGDDENNKLRGNDGNDTLEGRGGDDKLYGGGGNDKLWGGSDNDYLRGDAGDDTLGGQRGRDVLEGGSGNDKLYGGDGVDWLSGGQGDDQLWGGGNDGDQDTFKFEDGHGFDTIKDFEDGVDKIDLKEVSQIGSFDDLMKNHARENANGDVVIDTGFGSGITMEGTSLSDLSSDDFQFAPQTAPVQTSIEFSFVVMFDMEMM